MADVLPFAALRYNTRDKEKDLDLRHLIAPPYDVLTPENQQALYDLHPCNVVRLDLGKAQPNDDEFNNQYTRAASLLQTWKEEETLISDKKRSLYAYEQQFLLPDGGPMVSRRGFFATVRLMDYRSGRIRAHERTHAGPKADRLKLLRATQCNLSPIFCLFSDMEKKVASCLGSVFAQPPAEELTDDHGIVHRLWTITQKECILGVRETFKNKPLFIADGHHRYETALNYRDEMRELTGSKDGRQPFDYTLMYLNDFDDEGLVILPTHRVLSRELGVDIDLDEVLEDVGEYFHLKEFKFDPANPEKAAQAIGEKLAPPKDALMRCVMAVRKGRAWVLTLKKDADPQEMYGDEEIEKPLQKLDVTILHRFVIARGWMGNPEIEMEEGDIFYERNILSALDLLNRRKGCVAFFLNFTPKHQIQEIADQGLLLPQKSTYFHPKLPSGLVLRDLSTGFE